MITTKAGLIVVIAAMITAAVNTWKGYEACPWWMFWVVAFIAFVCLLASYIKQRWTEMLMSELEDAGLLDELETSTSDIATKIVYKMQEHKEKNEDNKED